MCETQTMLKLNKKEMLAFKELHRINPGHHGMALFTVKGTDYAPIVADVFWGKGRDFERYRLMHSGFIALHPRDMPKHEIPLDKKDVNVTFTYQQAESFCVYTIDNAFRTLLANTVSERVRIVAWDWAETHDYASEYIAQDFTLNYKGLLIAGFKLNVDTGVTNENTQ